MGIPDPKNIVGAFFGVQAAQMVPKGDIQVGVFGKMISGVPAPVAVHFIVESQQHRVVEIFQLPGMKAKVLVVLPVKHFVDEAGVTAASGPERIRFIAGANGA